MHIRIKNYLEKHDKKFKLKFDEVYLIKKPKNKWIIQKKFKTLRLLNIAVLNHLCNRNALEKQE